MISTSWPTSVLVDGDDLLIPISTSGWTVLTKLNLLTLEQKPLWKLVKHTMRMQLDRTNNPPLLLTCNDSAIDMYNADTGERLPPLLGHSGHVRDLHYARPLLVTRSFDGYTIGEIGVWN